MLGRQPQTVGVNFQAIQVTEAGFIPPDSMGDAGPSQLLVVSNGRIYYTSQASGFVDSQTYGEKSKKLPAVWERE